MPNQQDLYELENHLRQLFRGLRSAWSRFEEQGVSSAQAVILEKLVSEGPLKVSQIADSLYVTAGAVTSLADKLISGGFAGRARSEEDRRVVIMEITPQGREVVSSLQRHRQELLQSYFGHLPEEDVQHLNRIFRTILEESDTGL